MNIEDLTDEQKAKAKECKTTADLVALAQSEGVELTDEQLEAVAGGTWHGCTDMDVSRQVERY